DINDKVIKGGDGGGPSECDNQYHSDDKSVVALSTGWYKGGDRCHKYITKNGNGRSVKAMVVDEYKLYKTEVSLYCYTPNTINQSSRLTSLIEQMKNFNFLIVLVLQATFLFKNTNAQTFNPSGGIRGTKPPPGQCNQENDLDCCVQGKFYTTYTCSPPVTGGTKATLMINSFQKGGDGGCPSECDNQYHSGNTPVVALSTGWYKGGDRCHKYITINGNRRSVKAMVVDECDSTMGCDADHDYQPPCLNNIVDASKAV
nr:hypothetical protein [Tanacetum cinerariifolium]